MAEFTGERLVPELVNADLRNEHFARYAFAKQLAEGKRVLDAGCGLGYGTAELAIVAASAQGLDYAAEAVAEARSRYSALDFVEGSCEAMPFRAAQFDLVVAFEVIEHLTDWRAFLRECARVLVPGGQLAVSTPNREYYAESRKDAGPNPFHVHEFDAAEFRAELEAYFPEVILLLQNHAEGIAIAPPQETASGFLSVHNAPREAEANFFLAICSSQPIVTPPAFFYLPAAANVLRDRERHIDLLLGELQLKDATLLARNDEHRQLVADFRALQAQLEERNAWAAAQHRESVERGERITALQAELEERHRWAAAVNQESAARAERIQALQAELHESQQSAQHALAQIDADLAHSNAWAQSLQAELEALHTQLGGQLETAVADLAHCNQLLTAAEATVVERTQWAQDLSAKVDAAAASKWVRLGRKVGVGPQL